MTMIMGARQQEPFIGGGMNFNNHSQYSNSAPPHFNNPWPTTSTPSAPSSIYAPTGINPNLGPESIARQQSLRLNNNASTGSYNMPPTTASSGNILMDFSGSQQDLLTSQQDMMSPSRPLPTAYGSDNGYNSAPSPVHATYASAPSPVHATYASAPSPVHATYASAPSPVHATYASAPSPAHATYAPAPSQFDATGYAQPPSARAMYQMHQQQAHARRLSQPSVFSSSFYDLRADAPRSHRQNSLIDFNARGLQNTNTGFSRDATLDGARDMVAMSQNTAPKNIYGGPPRIGRGSGDAYGFAATHSTHSSISSSSTYPFYASVDSSVSEYSNGSDIELVSARTLPRPPGGMLGGGVPPAPQSMMGQFSSKVSSSTMKKHKCKICEKRFTRPSSLQTHVYSHTGEKRKASYSTLNSLNSN
ncbi:hypothetical protein NHQ30_009056 [Ciborinia camelliae]|nr:hypothetical protein NHQ30_009056 [Ciborinia camelliae]